MIFSLVLQGNSKGLVGADGSGGSLGSDYPKIPSGMDLSSSGGGGGSSGTVGNNSGNNNGRTVAGGTSSAGKRLKGMANRKLSPSSSSSHNNNHNSRSSPDFHSSSRSTPPLNNIISSHNIPNPVLGKYSICFQFHSVLWGNFRGLKTVIIVQYPTHYYRPMHYLEGV